MLGNYRVVTRCVGSGIKGVGSGIGRVGSGFTSHGIGSAVFEGSGIRLCHLLWDQGPNFVTLLESDQGSEILVQKWDSDEETYLVMTLKRDNLRPGILLTIIRRKTN